MAAASPADLDRVYRVLLVEDNDGDARLLLESARDAAIDLEIVRVGDLPAAVAATERGRFDVVLLDLGLPGSTSLETLNRFQESGQDVAVVVLTGLADEEAGIEALRLGAQDYLVKGRAGGDALGRVIAYAAERHRRQAVQRNQLAWQNLLTNAFRKALAAENPQQLLRQLAVQVRLGLEVDRAFVAQADGAGQLAVAEGAGWEAHPRGRILGAPEGDGFFTRVLRGGVPVSVPDLARLGPDADTVDGWLPAGASGLFVPVTGEGPHLLVAAVDTESSRHFGVAESGLLRQLGMVAASAMQRLAAQERLRRQEQEARRLATAVSVVANAVLIADVDGTIQWVNEAYARLSGYSIAEIVGSKPSIVKSGEHEDAFYRDLWETVTAGRVWRGRLVNRHKAGTLYTVDATITPVLGDDGQVEEFVAVQVDMTDVERLNREAVARRAELEALMGQFPGTLWVTDRDLVLRRSIGNVALATGVDEDTRIGRPLADFVGAPALAAHTRALHGEEVAYEFTDEGRVFHALAAPLRSLDDGVDGVIGVALDVTEQTTLLRRLEADEFRYRQLAQSASDIVAVARIDEGAIEVDYVNLAVDRILGYSPEDFSNWSVEEFAARTDIERVEVHWDTAVDGRAKVHVQHADGHWLWLDVAFAVVDPDTTPPTVQLTARDVTAQQQQQEALEGALARQVEATTELARVTALRDALLQNVSHEVRTPLTLVTGFATTLMRHGDELDEAQRHSISERLHASSERLHRIIDDMLVAAGQGGAPTQGGVETAVDVVRAMVARHDLHGREVVMDVADGGARVDGALLGSILHRLLDNVVRHTPPTARVWVRLREEGEMLELVVEDDGPGLHAVDDAAMFEPFVQGQGSLGQASPGAGLGLAIVRANAEILGGTVEATEREGGGTRMVVRVLTADAIDARSGTAGVRPAGRRAPTTEPAARGSARPEHVVTTGR